MAYPEVRFYTRKLMSRYPELAAKVDGFFARVQVRHGAEMACTSGCSHCCHTRLTVTGVEAAAIAMHISTWSAAQRTELAANVAGAAPDRCTALDATGRCMIYAARPIVCRSHGAPIRLRENSLPVVSACRDNFTARGPGAADPDCIIDQETLSAMTLAVDRDAGGDGSRSDLEHVLASALHRG